MAKFFCILKIALRAAIWKATPQACTVGIPTLLGWSLVATAAGIANEYDLAGATGWFNPYGLNSAVAQIAVFLAVACLFVPAQLRATFLSAFIASGLLIKAVELLTVRVSAHWPFAIQDDLHWLQRYQHTALFVIELIWWIGAVYVAAYGVPAASLCWLVV